MTSIDRAALIDHGPGCARPAPVLRLSWRNEPEVQCQPADALPPPLTAARG